MSEQLNTINERLKHLRKNVLRLTQSELGNTLGLGKAAVSKMEIRYIRVKTMIKMRLLRTERL